MKNNNKEAILKKAIIFIILDRFENLKEFNSSADYSFISKRLFQLNLLVSEPFDFYNVALGVSVNANSKETIYKSGIDLPLEFEDFISFLEDNQDLYSPTALMFLARRADNIFKKVKLSA